MSSAFGGGVLPLKSEISDSSCRWTERWRVYEGSATLGLGLALCLGLAHLLELRSFGEDFRPPFVGHDGGVRSSDRPVVYPVITLFCSLCI